MICRTSPAEITASDFQRDDPIASIEIVPESALHPETTDAKAERLIRNGDPAGLIKTLTPLALANPPPANDAKQLAGNMAHAARLVRSIVEDRVAELTEAGEPNAPLQAVRDEFREVLDPAGLIKTLTPLALANPPPANDAKQLAGNMAHAARLVRSIVEDRVAELTEAGEPNAPLQAVRDEFREVLYAHPQAAGYDAKRFDPLFAAAFAQTLAFGLLLVREATDRTVGREAWQNMPPEHALMRTTLRVLSMEEIVRDVGVGFDVILDTGNSFEPAILARKTGKPEPILYLKTSCKFSALSRGNATAFITRPSRS
jgi:hypothetical protein